MKSIVKSASKHYSPLRYPGGKACLSEFLSGLIRTNGISNCTYVEPYAGGAGAALTLLFLEKVDNIIINDLDKAIYSFWRSVLTQTEKFIDLVFSAKLSMKEWQRQREIYRNKNSKQLELGFATFYLNRTNRSGIIEGGPIGGSKQDGKWLIDARFNKAELITRIENIASYKDRISIKNLDGIELLKKIPKDRKHFVYLDPPYYVKGSCLYLNHYEDDNHTRLARYLNSRNNFFWVMTYDNVPQIKDLYTNRRQHDFSLHYHVDLPKIGKEILVFSDRVALN